MKLLCIRGDGLRLTKGEIYNAFPGTMAGHVVVVDNMGHLQGYYLSRFQIVPETRGEYLRDKGF